MTEPATLQRIMNQTLPAYAQQHRLSGQQYKVCRHIQQCRTPALGGLQLQCDQCGATTPLYHACRDRHCPQCQHRASTQWCERQQAQVLPVTYYHVVFTLPHALNGWVQLHPEVLYRRMFRCVWSTLKALGADPKRLGGQLGATVVLHTWGQNLSQHVHLHCLLPGGALTQAGQWHAAKSTYLFPVRALSRCFRGKLVVALRRAWQQGELHRITRPGEVDKVLNALMQTDWVVYSKPCLTHTQSVVDYLGRYSHRIALSDARLLSFDGAQVQLLYKDYRDGSRHKVMTLSTEELLRRYLLHVLPKGLMRIRHYGFLANRCRQEKLKQICAALAEAVQAAGDAAPAEGGHTTTKVTPPMSVPFEGYPCPTCRQGQLWVVGHLLPQRDESG